MSDITALSRIIQGSARNVDISSNTLVVLTIKIGGSVSNTELNKAILDKLVLIESIADADGSYDTRYTKIGDLASRTSGKGASLVALQDAGAYFTTKNVEAALQQLGAALGTGTAAGISYDHTASGLSATNVQDAIDQTVVLANAAQTTANAAIPATQKGVANGVATLDSGGKVPVSQLPTAVLGDLQYQGTLAATGSLPSTPTMGWYWVISTGGTFTGTTHAFAAGDWLVANGSGSAGDVAAGFDYVDNNNKVQSVNGATGTVVLTTDNISEGTTNLYFLTTRAQTAAVVNSLGGSQTVQAPSVAAVNTALTGKQAASANLTAADTFFGGTTFTFTQANQLIQAGNADSLHSHAILKKIGTAGESFAANTTFAVRMAVVANSETAQRFRKADITTTSFDLMYVVGLLQSAGALTNGSAATIVTNGTLILGSSDTNFSSGDVGKPVFLTASGTFSVTPPSTAGQAVTRIGIIEDVDRIFVQPSVVGVL